MRYTYDEHSSSNIAPKPGDIFEVLLGNHPGRKFVDVIVVDDGGSRSCLGCFGDHMFHDAEGEEATHCGSMPTGCGRENVIYHPHCDEAKAVFVLLKLEGA